MTPFQRLVYGWSQMDVTVQDLDGDDFPDEILWEYELLLNTTEGLQWQARMDTSYPHVSAGFDDFNGFDVDVLTILRDTTERSCMGRCGQRRARLPFMGSERHTRERLGVGKIGRRFKRR
ncbi:MAG: hypothetical protein CM15mP79_0460 [Methanobacteriota archaeon]|nr:MAG: hypothetical protein CM15mP79_0460 [Euryarchaeota archaeon]